MQRSLESTFPRKGWSSVELYPLRSRLIKPGDSIGERLVEALHESKLRLRHRDIVAVASKIVALTENALRDLSTVKVSAKAVRLGREYFMPASFVQVVMDEADMIYGGVKGALLTLKDGEAVANAGVDQKNSPEGFAVVWPSNSDASAARLRAWAWRVLGKRIGVVVVDSRVTPLRQIGRAHV